MTSTDRYAKGVRTTEKAIATGDPKLLKRCIATFKRLQTPGPDIGAALMDCPLGLLQEAGHGLVIESAVLDQQLTIGTDITTEEIALLLKTDPSKVSLRTVMAAKMLFRGTITETEALPNEEVEDPDDFYS